MTSLKIPLNQNEGSNEKAFFYFLTAALIFVGGWSVAGSEVLREPTRLIPFVALLAIHIGLYWLVIPITNKPRLVPAFLILQALIALVLNLIGQTNSLPFGLYMGLIGLTVGIYNLTRLSAGLILVYLLLSLYSYSRVMDLSEAVWWLIIFSPMLVFVIIYVVLYNRQTEARTQALKLAAELEEANRRLSDYAERVEALTLANERQRMARELHDTLSQGLAGLILQLEAADAHLDANRTERARSIVQQTMAQARNTLTSARRAIDDLRQQPADLAEAVRLEAERFSQITGIPCAVDFAIGDPVPNGLSETAQRAVAEALANTASHAQANRVTVSVTGNAATGLSICIADDGIGFDPHSAIGKPGHYGLMGIRERSRLAGGTLVIESQPGEGAKIILHLPYEAAPIDQPGTARRVV